MSYKLTRIAAPKRLLTLAEIRAHLRVTGSDDDAYIASIAGAVIDHMEGPEGVLGRALMSQQWRVTVDAFPRSSGMRLPLPPTISIDAVKYVDTASVLQTVAANTYQLVETQGRARLMLAPAKSWPGDINQAAGSVQVEFTAGYGEASDVPSSIKAAALLSIGWLYERREGSITGTIVAANPAVKALLNPHIVDAYGLDGT